MYQILNKRSLLNKKVMQVTRKMSLQLVKVPVNEGIVVGQKKTLPSGNFFQSFQGIPYAVPPIGKLRFKSPVPLKKFHVPELLCLKDGNVSIQRDPFSSGMVGSEDCLFLNVYVPETSMGISKPLPIMVWIHGGGFCFGNGNSDYHLPLSLLEEGVIVVTVNYRLGALGFLCLPEEGIWGNAGLKDQRQALQWVHDNIEAFNGDTNNVTLFGESAGAVSVHLHMMSKHANSLFHKAIMQSGTANMEWVFQTNPAYKARRLAELIGFKANDTKQLLNFMQSPETKPSDILANTIPVMTSDERRRCMPFLFKPVIEDSRSSDIFISQPILQRLKKPYSIEMPAIMGYNSAEGLAMIPHALKNLEELDKDFHRLVPRDIPFEPEDNELKLIGKKMRDFYLNGKSIKPEGLNNLVNIFSDYHFVFAMQNAARWHAKLQPHAPLYFYRFEYVGDRNMHKNMLKLHELHGACHGDELFYLFQMTGDDMKNSDRDKKVTNQLSNLWANFAKYGNPTPENAPPLGKFYWSPLEKTHTLNYLAIGNNGCQMKTNPDQDRMEFWQNIYYKYPPIDLSYLSFKL